VSYNTDTDTGNVNVAAWNSFVAASSAALHLTVLSPVRAGKKKRPFREASLVKRLLRPGIGSGNEKDHASHEGAVLQRQAHI